MALEISEIGVRIAVGETPPQPSAGARGGSGGREVEALSPARVEELVQACVRDVLRTLRMLEER